MGNTNFKDSTMNELAHSYAAITKSEKQEDGTLKVYGKATDDTVDIDQQICDEDWLKKAMPDWFTTGGNVREQHSNIAAGVATNYEAKADGHYITALVVDPVSVKKVETGVLKGFSIGIRGPRVIRDNKAAGGRIVDGQIVEVSLVDRPANPNAKLMLAKAADNGELVNVAQVNIPSPADVARTISKSDDVADAIVEEVAEVVEAIVDAVADATPDVDVDATEDVDADVEKRAFSEERRSDLAESGAAMPDGSYPIVTVADLKNAIQSLGRAKDVDATKKHIIDRARALDAIDKLPEEWNVGKAADATLVKYDDNLYNRALEALTELIKAETDEIVTDGDDETEDIKCLLKSLKHLQKWHALEVEKGEAEAIPSDAAHLDEDDEDEMEDSYLVAKNAGCDCANECVCATTKSADADLEGTPADTGADLEETVPTEQESNVAIDETVVAGIVEKAVAQAKATVESELDLLKSAIKAEQEKAAQLEVALEAANKAALAGGPKRSRVNATTEDVADLNRKAAVYAAKAAATTDTVLAKGYRELAEELTTKATKIAGKGF